MLLSTAMGFRKAVGTNSLRKSDVVGEIQVTLGVGMCPSIANTYISYTSEFFALSS